MMNAGSGEGGGGFKALRIPCPFAILKGVEWILIDTKNGGVVRDDIGILAQSGPVGNNCEWLGIPGNGSRCLIETC